ncbi:MAG: hypothetical protein OXJ52_04565 [Oligoflexia bacterium]|nr:hypothetical protein [Oligoflexia bacterium]
MEINQARLQVQLLCRLPDFIYKNLARLWLIPFLAITSIPVRYLLDLSYWTWLAILSAVVFLFWFIIILGIIYLTIQNKKTCFLFSFKSFYQTLSIPVSSSFL